MRMIYYYYYYSVSIEIFAQYIVINPTKTPFVLLFTQKHLYRVKIKHRINSKE